MIYSQAMWVLLLLPAIVQAHVCMWAPEQRNGYSIETPGESLCYLKVGPCGGVPSAAPKTTLVGGQDFTIQFQQNLNHYYIENPGKLVADYSDKADPAEEDFTPLGSVADYNAMNEITQTNFTLRVSIPNVDVPHGVVRLRYVSQNPTENDRGTTFYQCADVTITPTARKNLRPAPRPVLMKPDNKESECCTAPQFTMDGFETSSWRQDTVKKYYFDSVNKLFRVDTNSGSGTTAKDGYFQMFSNFTSGIEYYYNVHANTCDLYGLNYWSDWCYGSVNQQVLTETSTDGSDFVHTWAQEGTPFRWSNVHKGCVPFSMTRVDTKENTRFMNMKVGAPDASSFTLPAACVRSEAALKDRNSLPKSPIGKHF